jgi:hypothetical protein
MRAVAFRAGQNELKYGASRLVCLCPQAAPVGVDDGPANRQSHPDPAGLRGVESVKNALAAFRINARPRIAHRDKDAACPAFLCADQQLSRPLIDRVHCFDCVQDQVQDDLLQLDTIPFNGRQPLHKASLDIAVLGDCALRQPNHLSDRLIEINTILSRRRFFDVSPNSIDYIAGSIRVAHYTAERFPGLA